MNFKRLTLSVIHLDAVDSTNNYAANLLKTIKVESGTVIMTKRQTAGKGQRGNSWVTEPGKNLIFSVILFPQLPVSKAFNLTMAISLAAQKTLSQYLPGVTVKWPNDIYVKNKKIAGILVENQLRGDTIISSVVGIGINVNQQQFSGLPNACSFFSETGRDADPGEVFSRLYDNIDFYFNLLLEKNYHLLTRLYHSHLFRINEQSPFEDDGGRFQGRINGVNEQGKLMIQREDRIAAYDLKEIKFVTE